MTPLPILLAVFLGTENSSSKSFTRTFSSNTNLDVREVSLMSRNACNGENGETGEKSPAAGDLNWMPKAVPWRLAISAKMAILAKLAILAGPTYFLREKPWGRG